MSLSKWPFILRQYSRTILHIPHVDRTREYPTPPYDPCRNEHLKCMNRKTFTSVYAYIANISHMR